LKAHNDFVQKMVGNHTEVANVVTTFVSDRLEFTIADPKSYRQAMNSPFKEEWKNLMREELKSLLNNRTWQPIQQLPTYNVHAVRFK
jgi:hypothetical protein